MSEYGGMADVLMVVNAMFAGVDGLYAATQSVVVTAVGGPGWWEGLAAVVAASAAARH